MRNLDDMLLYDHGAAPVVESGSGFIEGGREGKPKQGIAPTLARGEFSTVADGRTSY